MKLLQVVLFTVAIVDLSFSSQVSAQVKLSFPPWNNMNCSFIEPGVEQDSICTPSVDPSGQIIFSYDNDVLSTRWAYNPLVRLYKKGTKYASSFATSFTININRDSERSVKRVFGGGIAFSITPDQDTTGAGRESMGLFPIDLSTGDPLSEKSPRTVAVEIDTSREENEWDGKLLPHLGIDINSMKSVKSAYLWEQTKFINRRIGYFVDYDAKTEVMQVRVQNITSNGKLDKKKSKLWLSYPKLKLSDHVNEYSVVGFSSRVPTTDDGTYKLYEWNFESKEVLTDKIHK